MKEIFEMSFTVKNMFKRAHLRKLQGSLHTDIQFHYLLITKFMKDIHKKINERTYSLLAVSYM